MNLHCLVKGALQEISKDLHAILDILADSKLRARGRKGTEMERTSILSEFHRELIAAGVKSYSGWLHPAN